VAPLGRRRSAARDVSTLATACGAALATALITATLVRDRNRARRLEQEVAERLPLGPSGVIVGAEPEYLRGSATHAVLLVHGFGDTPQSMRQLAHGLHAEGWTVELSLLPGHGRSLREFGQGRAHDWIDQVRRQVARLTRTFPHVALVGQSMGAALSAIVAAEHDELDALVLLAPYLSMPARVRRVAPLLRMSGPLAPFRRSAYGTPSIRDPEALRASLGFGVVSGRLLRELHAVTEVAQQALPEITVPTLYLASRHDNRVPAEAAVRNWERLGATERTFQWVERSGHVISVDRDRAIVARETTQWLARWAGQPT
jgi:carboxylesterase